MIKSYYLKEISGITTCKIGSRGNDVKRIQEWLCLQALLNSSLATTVNIDGRFGPATENAVKNFQKSNGLKEDGIVDNNLFYLLSKPLKNAYEDLPDSSLSELVVLYAQQHLNNKPVEFQINGIQNTGPWVRSYCQGNEGNDWPWCMGFVQTILDLAFSRKGLKFTSAMPFSYGCDYVAKHAIDTGKFIKNVEIRTNPAKAKAGDVFLIRKTPTDWIHTGIISKVSNDFFETIEGNTNTAGSPNGYGVFKRIRNFRTTTIDVFSI